MKAILFGDFVVGVLTLGLLANALHDGDWKLICAYVVVLLYIYRAFDNMVTTEALRTIIRQDRASLLFTVGNYGNKTVSAEER